ncbi:hypothetical protein ACFPJ4_03550 [Lysinimonas soli]|uniref:Integral membrane protein n=1 Tax=Lysinimonas soli TaxID=1074233 RepID=A0ABW0NNV3_9MICO
MLERRPLPSLVFLPIGVVSAIVGLLPWLVTGMRLPLQNLWATGALPAEMPIVLLPFSQYTLILLIALLLIGAATAGIAGRAVPAQHPGIALLALMGGVLLVQLIALIQTAATVSHGLRGGSQSTLYLVVVVGGAVISIVLGVALVALIARAPRPGALIGLSVAAVAFSSWLTGLFFPTGAVYTASPLTSLLSQATRYVPAVLIGIAIAWCGVRSVGRVIAAIASLLLLWVGMTAVIAVNNALGSRVLAHHPADMLDQAAGVFRSALVLPELWLPTVGLAVAVAAVGLVARRVISTRSNPLTADPG